MQVQSNFIATAHMGWKGIALLHREVQLATGKDYLDVLKHQCLLVTPFAHPSSSSFLWYSCFIAYLATE